MSAKFTVEKQRQNEERIKNLLFNYLCILSMYKKQSKKSMF